MPENSVESSKPSSGTQGTQLSPQVKASWVRASQEMKPDPKTEEKKPGFLQRLFKREKRPVETQFKISKTAEQLAAEKFEVTPAQEAVAIITLLQGAKRAKEESQLSDEEYEKLEEESDRKLIDFIRKYEIDQPPAKPVPGWYTAAFEAENQAPSFRDTLFKRIDELGLEAGNVYSYQSQNRPSIWDKTEKHPLPPNLQNWLTEFQKSPYYNQIIEEADRQFGRIPIFPNSRVEIPKPEVPLPKQEPAGPYQRTHSTFK